MSKWTRVQRWGWCMSHVQVDEAQRLPEVGVRVAVEGVQVAAHGAGEEHRVLRDGGDAASHLVQPQAQQVHPVHGDCTLSACRLILLRIVGHTISLTRFKVEYIPTCVQLYVSCECTGGDRMSAGRRLIGGANDVDMHLCRARDG